MNLDEFLAVLPHLDLTVGTKKPVEDPHDAKLRRFKDRWLFIVTVWAIIISLSGWALFLICRPESPHVQAVLNGGFGLLMALTGYYVRGRG